MKGILNIFALAFKAAYYKIRWLLFFFFKNTWKRRKFNNRSPVPKGHRMYMLNKKGRTLKVVEPTPTNRTTKRGATASIGVGVNYNISEIKIPKGSMLITALNDRNAQKKALKFLNFSGYESDRSPIKFIRTST